MWPFRNRRTRMQPTTDKGEPTSLMGWRSNRAKRIAEVQARTAERRKRTAEVQARTLARLRRTLGPQSVSTDSATSNLASTGSSNTTDTVSVFDRAKQAAQADDAASTQIAAARYQEDADAVQAAAADWFIRMGVRPVPVTTGRGGGVDVEFLTAYWELEGRSFRGTMLLTGSGSYGTLRVEIKVEPVWCSYPKGRCQYCPHESWRDANNLTELGLALRSS